MFTTPGVYFEQVDRGRPAIGTLRTDIAGFVGYTERGPLAFPIPDPSGVPTRVAVRLTGWRQFQAVFGEPLDFAHLAYAVRGFFENGGTTCYVVRVADADIARPAEVTLVDADELPVLRLWASHGTVTNPATGDPHSHEGQPLRFDSAGAWGNRLAVSLSPGSLGAARVLGHTEPDGAASTLDSLSGIETGSVVRLTQPLPDRSGLIEAYLEIDTIEPQTREVRWSTPLGRFGFDLDALIPVETVEWTLMVHFDGQVVERFVHTSLSPRHSRFIVEVIRANSRLVDVEVLSTAVVQPVSVDRAPLVGGEDGLSTVSKGDFLAGLEALSKVDEVSLIAAPDLVLRAQPPPSSRRAETVRDVCKTTEPPPSGQLQGVVLRHIRRPTHVEGEDEGVPIAGVRVRLLGDPSRFAYTDREGRFRLTGLPVGRVTLLLERPGFFDLEVVAQARSAVPGTARFFMEPITLPPPMSPDDIFDVQSAMVRQGELGLYRVALLDSPPASTTAPNTVGIEEIQTWRSRFDSAFGALYYPWLLVRSVREGDEVRVVPPSGHVAGLIARTDLSEGVHRAPANAVLEGVKALTHTIDDVQQGILNPLGINCIRVLPGRGIRIYGARTLSSDTQWTYLNVRRLLLMIEEAIEEAHQWTVFEPNNVVLRQALTFSVSGFLTTLWQEGALAGDTPNAAFQVVCDESNNPQEVADAGRVVADVGVAPTIPFEFVRFRLGRTIEAMEVTE